MSIKLHGPTSPDSEGATGIPIIENEDHRRAQRTELLQISMVPASSVF